MQAINHPHHGTTLDYVNSLAETDPEKALAHLQGVPVYFPAGLASQSLRDHVRQNVQRDDTRFPASTDSQGEPTITWWPEQAASNPIRERYRHVSEADERTLTRFRHALHVADNPLQAALEIAGRYYVTAGEYPTLTTMAGEFELAQKRNVPGVLLVTRCGSAILFTTNSKR
jgi:hypothetical protein